MNQSRKPGGYIFTVNMKSMQFILPISMLSFLFSQSPGFDGLLDFLQIYGFDSTSTISIRAKRAYAFLFFNGLLALLINNSGAFKRVPESITRTLKTAIIKTTVFKDIVEEDLAWDDEECDETEEYDRCDDILDDDDVADRATKQVLAGEQEEFEETHEYDIFDDVLDDDDVADRATKQVLAGEQEECEETHEYDRFDDVLDDDDVADRATKQVLAGEQEGCEETHEYVDVTNDDVLADDEEDEDDRCDDLILSDESDEEETEEVVWGISVEELNSKCDDFIKNMRHLL